jgi:hypothetical protein
VTTAHRCAASDLGREAVYAAEEAALGGTDFDAPRPFADLVELAAGVVAGSWWQACGGPRLELVAARAGAVSSSARTGTRHGVLVRLASGQLTAATVAHELAHALTGVASGHDKRFRAVHVDVVALLGGRSLADDLQRCYADHGVAPGARAWPPPHRAVGSGFVMIP